MTPILALIRETIAGALEERAEMREFGPELIPIWRSSYVMEEEQMQDDQMSCEDAWIDLGGEG